MNNFLCTYTGKWPKIAIIYRKKGSPSEDVASNAVMHTTTINPGFCLSTGKRS